jgi:hypothetical protein
MLAMANEGEMHVREYLESIGYGIENGSQFLWTCYGSDAWYLDGKRTSAVIDRQTGFVYEVSMNDEEKHFHPKWIHPEYLDGYVNEATDRGCEPWQAYDDVMYTQITDEAEILGIIKDGNA